MDLSGLQETISTRGKIFPERSRMVGSVNGKSIIVPRMGPSRAGRIWPHATTKPQPRGKARRMTAAISQSRSGSVGSRLIRQVLAVCDGAGRFCRGGKTSGSASAEPFGEEKERNAMHPDKKARRVSIVAGNQLESGCAVTTN